MIFYIFFFTRAKACQSISASSCLGYCISCFSLRCVYQKLSIEDLDGAFGYQCIYILPCYITTERTSYTFRV